MITPAESKFVGFEHSMIDEYPTLVDVSHADRIQLIKWYRFLRPSKGYGWENVVYRHIVNALVTSFPVHEQEQQ